MRIRNWRTAALLTLCGTLLAFVPVTAAAAVPEEVAGQALASDQSPTPEQSAPQEGVAAEAESPPQQESSATEQAPAPEQTPAQTESSATEQTPAQTETPAPEQTPAPEETPVPDEIEEGPTQATFEYSPGLKVDAYWNVGVTDAPWVVLIHGGYWMQGSRSSYTETAARFRDAGFAAFAIDYRRTGTAPWPAQRNDAIAAMDWIKANAALFGIAPRRVVVLGDSAGGHIALSLATAGRGKDRVTGAVALSAPSDPYTAWRSGHTSSGSSRTYRLADAALMLHRCTPWEKGSKCWNLWLDTNVKLQAGKDDAPMLLVHAKKDPIVPLSHSAAFRSKAVSLGASVKWVTPSNGDHGTGLLKAKSIWDPVLHWAKLRTRA